MSAILAITLYLGLALALTLLRLEQEPNPLDASMAGLLWPFEMLFTGIDAAAQLAIPSEQHSK